MTDVHFVNVDDKAESSSLDGHFKLKEVIESTRGKPLSIPSSLFSIPTLPAGDILSFNILSTWGDPYYVGLMGIDLFDGTGHPIVLDDVERQVSIPVS